MTQFLRKQKRSISILGACLCVLVIAAVVMPAEASAAIKIFGTNIECDPAKAPASGGCGFAHFIEVIRATINFLMRVAIPLAAVFIAWGGIIIMSAAGSTEKVAQGKKIITAAIVGIVILLGAWLVIATLYVLLPVGGVGNDIKNTLFQGRI